MPDCRCTTPHGPVAAICRCHGWQAAAQLRAMPAGHIPLAHPNPRAPTLMACMCCALHTVQARRSTIFLVVLACTAERGMQHAQQPAPPERLPGLVVTARCTASYPVVLRCCRTPVPCTQLD